MIPAILLFIGMIFLPESPRWFARKDLWEACLYVLTLVHGKGDPEFPSVRREYEEIKAMCEFERQNADVSYLELFKPKMINRVQVGVFTQIWSQLTGMLFSNQARINTNQLGINIMMYYITYVFGTAGLKGNHLLVSSSISYIINVFCAVRALLWVDRWGRRPTLLAGAVAMMAFLYADGGLMATYGKPDPHRGVNNQAAES